MPCPVCSIVTAKPEHIPHIAAGMRPADQAEVRASHNFTAQEALARSLGISTRAWCVLLDGEPAAMLGVGAARSLLSNTGAPWLLATSRIYEITQRFLRLSRPYAALMQRDFPRLENHVHAANRASIRWLVWCGFQLAARPEPYGCFNELFYRFWRNQCAVQPPHPSDSPAC